MDKRKIHSNLNGGAIIDNGREYKQASSSRSTDNLYEKRSMIWYIHELGFAPGTYEKLPDSLKNVNRQKVGCGKKVCY